MLQTPFVVFVFTCCFYISCQFCFLLQILIIISLCSVLHWLFPIFTILLPCLPLLYSSFSTTTFTSKPFNYITYMFSDRESSTHTICTTTASITTIHPSTTISTTSLSSVCFHHPPTRILPTTRQHFTKILADCFMLFTSSFLAHFKLWSQQVQLKRKRKRSQWLAPMTIFDHPCLTHIQLDTTFKQSAL